MRKFAKIFDKLKKGTVNKEEVNKCNKGFKMIKDKERPD